jgi:hypothetical protein
MIKAKTKKKKNDPFQKHSKDHEIETKLAELVERFHIGPLDLLKNFPIFARRVTLKRFLAHYELFRKTVDLPGDIVELGVFRGASLFTWANFLEARAIGSRTKKVWGFDNFTGFSGLGDRDGPAVPRLQKVTGGFSPAQYYEELKAAIALFDEDRFAPWKPRIELVEGDVEKTVPAFVEKNPGLRISILHFDIDLYGPTMVGLRHLFPRVVSGGIVIFDEYAILEWGGESAAVEEYLAGQGYRLKTFEWNNSPGAYVIKK